MPEYHWDEDKNNLLKQTRNVSFEDVVSAIKRGHAITEVAHPNPLKYPRQKLLIVIIEKYTYVVPIIKTDNTYFLKTIYASRKYHKKYFYKGVKGVI